MAVDGDGAFFHCRMKLSGYNAGMQEKNGQPVQILVVDDNQPFRRLVTAWLLESGYQVVEAQDGEDALTKLAIHTIDLILLDLQMEPLGGFHFKDAVRGTPLHNIPTLLITSDSSSDMLMRAARMGFSAVMKKPIERVRLLRMIEQQLDRRPATSL